MTTTGPALAAMMAVLLMIMTSVALTAGQIVLDEPYRAAPNYTYVNESFALYVSPDGDDDTGNGTQGNPYATVWKGVDRVAFKQKFESSTIRDVLVLPGLYAGDGFTPGTPGGNFNFSHGAYDVVITGVGGPNETVIDCGYKGYGIHLASNGMMALQNLTWRNCLQKDGGAIRISNANDVRIVNVVIENSIAEELGGGVFATDTDKVLIDNLQCYNNTAGTGGGCLYAQQLTGTLSNSVMRNNSADYGGAVFLAWLGVGSEGYANTVTHNAATTQGGGMYARDSSFNVTDNLVAFNTADQGGGLMWWQTKSVAAENQIAFNNATSDDDGHNVYCLQSTFYADTTNTVELVYGSVLCQLCGFPDQEQDWCRCSNPSNSEDWCLPPSIEEELQYDLEDDSSSPLLPAIAVTVACIAFLAGLMRDPIA